jgi:hypothetical protein
LNEHLTLTLSAQRRVKLRGSILARLRQLKLFVRQPRRPAPEAGPQSVRCPSRSCATTSAKCRGRSGKGTVVPRPSVWRNCLCEPFCRTSPNPRPSRRAATSRGLSVGSLPTTQP